MWPHKRQQLEPRDTSPTIFQEIFGRLVRQNLLAKSQRHNQNWDVISMYTIFSIQSSSKLIWHSFPTHFGYCLFSVVPRIFGHKFFYLITIQIQQIENWATIGLLTKFLWCIIAQFFSSLLSLFKHNDLFCCVTSCASTVYCKLLWCKFLLSHGDLIYLLSGMIMGRGHSWGISTQ